MSLTRGLNEKRKRDYIVQSHISKRDRKLERQCLFLLFHQSQKVSVCLFFSLKSKRVTAGNKTAGKSFCIGMHSVVRSVS